MSQTPNLDAARASLQQAIDQANAIVKPIIDAMREAGMLTPAPEPAAAPAVDDDLLRAIGREACAAYFANEGAHSDKGADAWRTGFDLLASEPMQRLRAAWTAAEAAEYAESLRHQDAAYGNLERERDETRAELATTIERWNRAYTEVVKNMNEGWKADRDQLKAEVERLRAAWAAEAVRSGDVVERAQYDHVLTEAKVVERERDEAYRQKTEWQATAGRIAAERDEARAELIRVKRELVDALALVGPACSCVKDRVAKCHEGHCCVAGPGIEKTCHQAEADAHRNLAEAREVIGEIGELVDPWMGFDGFITDGVKAVIAEVEHLCTVNAELSLDREVERRRAAQQLPDVGPVTRDENGDLSADGLLFLGAPEGGYWRAAARLLAVAAFLDAEAADTSSDEEEVRELSVVLSRADIGYTVREDYDRLARAVIAHRARSGQEAGL